jgi:hypothetical protein
MWRSPWMLKATSAKGRDSLLQNRFIVAMFSALIVSGCAVTRSYEASRPTVIDETEAILSDAGFKTIKIDTSERVGLATNLPPHEIRSYDGPSGTVYRYYDPDICSRVYEGRQDEFDRYEMLVKQQNDISQYGR